MCCLFGLIDYGRRLSGRQRGRILSALAVQSEVRGTDATGYAYCSGGRLHIYKQPLPARQVPLFVPSDAWVIMGHTRMTTQGSARKNRNNHPFRGNAGGTHFALAHNGVLCNDGQLRKDQKLPKTRIETDSYVAVQLLGKENALTPDSLKTMAEQVGGTFVFTVLDEENTLSFIRGDNPLCLYHFPGLGLYLYASTEQILRSGLARTWLSNRHRETISVERGEILRIDPEGRRQTSRFALAESYPCWVCGPLTLHHSCRGNACLEELKSLSYSFGYTPETVERLFREGFTTDEIEEIFYGWDEL